VLRIAYEADIPMRIAHSHSTFDGKADTLPRGFYRWLTRRSLYRYATLMLGCSPPACEALFGKGCWMDSRVQVLNYALDLEPYAQLPADRDRLREKVGLPPIVPLIGHVGRFDVPKNHCFLIEVFAALLRRLPNAHLVLVGDGPLRTEIEEWISRQGLADRVHLLGVRPDIPHIMGCLDVFLFPSRWEGLGIVLIEAQAAGVPCVVSEAVPREADLGIDLVEWVSLDRPLEDWVAAVLHGLQTPRPTWEDRLRSLQAAGYDVLQAAPALQEVYLGGG
ncbi:MAG: glycosyltransferase, partial [Anaerolineae bacterium]